MFDVSMYYAISQNTHMFSENTQFLLKKQKSSTSFRHLKEEMFVEIGKPWAWLQLSNSAGPRILEAF